MDERDTFASEATGEPLGSMELFASPGGVMTVDRDPRSGAEVFFRLYGEQFQKAKEEGKERVIWLMPHTCSADSHAGCAAFKMDEVAQKTYFTALAAELEKNPVFEGAEIRSAFYDTDTHQVSVFHGPEASPNVESAVLRLQRSVGVASSERRGALDQAHSGNRIYVGRYPRAWSAERNTEYALSSQMKQEELLQGIALAIKVIKTHSHVNTAEVPIVIQLDQTKNGEILFDTGLLQALNGSELLKGANIVLAPAEVLIVETKTDSETWNGSVEAWS
jgi:hypothetical protein